ncbi:inositol monophosphatase family protein [Amycolatopsis magusensis]|uniref:inositol monophosphatase family protein n=1 Tax=Amycolatopsis magusensis TaxID=882444 RepID=UPI0024A7A585|nr:inositol monophosphatase family protein [Amycolatopsis magusensis]MDI5978277.1 inositol monophosphatase family protein [Amycolatopsis magusensis]
MGELAHLEPVAAEALDRAARIIGSRIPDTVTLKGDRDLVTDVDLAVEDAVREFLAAETPEIGFLGEEHGHSGPGGRWWVLDPVDGTSNLAHGIPLCGVALGLVDGQRGVLAAIDLPFLGTRYTAVEGGGAFAGDQPIRIADVDRMSDAVLSVGDFAVGEGAEEKNRVRLGLLARLGARAHRIRMLGSAAIDLAWVAHGKLAGTVILSNLPWDTAAGVLLVREAGGLVLDGDGSEHTVDSAATIAVGPALHAELLELLRQAERD